MKEFIGSFSPFLKKLKKFKRYQVEVFLLSLAFIITIISLILYQKNESPESNLIKETQSSYQKENSSQRKIFVDIAGAVNNPGMHEATLGARLKDILTLAGGLSDEADRIFFQRNFNLARIVTDQEKIYIPSSWEINSGIFIENSRTLDYISPQNITQTEAVSQNSPQNINEKISLNQASIEELDTLPGIGKVTAQKIINNRPYQSIDELLTKKVVGKSTFEKIKDLISL
jgi:competence protein ComEA